MLSPVFHAHAQIVERPEFLPCAVKAGFGDAAMFFALVARGQESHLDVELLDRALVCVDFLQRVGRAGFGDFVASGEAAAVVAEAELALVLANAYMDKFGRDVLVDALGAFGAYVGRITVR